VIRVPLGDLAYDGQISILRSSRALATDEHMLRQVLGGLRAL
jgi:hypothetical protein